MSTETRPVVVGVGAGAEDIFLKPYEKVGQLYVPGAKHTWTPDAQRKFEDVETRPRDYERHIGGNALNTIVPFDRQSWDVNFLTSLGHNRVSHAIRANLAHHGIKLFATMREDYEPSVSLVESEPGKDRSIYGRPRDRLEIDFSDKQIAALLRRADIAIAASLKNHDLSEELAFTLRQENPDAFYALAPGSSEFKDTQQLRNTIKTHRPNVFAMNRQEALQFLEADTKDSSKRLAKKLLQFADRSSVSDGTNGLYLASNGEVIHYPAAMVSSEKIKNTVGAGDRVNHHVIEGFYGRKPMEMIARDAVHGASRVIQYNGAHGDFDEQRS